MILFRVMTGLSVGFEIAPDEGVYLVIYLGVVEIVFISEDYVDD